MITPGTIIDGRYQIVGPLGSGGMGEVYRARRQMLGDEVAIKVMHASSDAPLDHRERFLREEWPALYARLKRLGLDVEKLVQDSRKTEGASS